MILRIWKSKVTLNSTSLKYDLQNKEITGNFNSTSLKYDLQNKEIRGNFKFYISQI